MGGRIFERKRRQMPCTLTLDGRNHGGLILDVSPGGLFIQSSAKIKPGDQLEVQTTLPGVEGRLRIQVEVVRKVVVPSHLIKVARGGVGVRIINAPEAYYQFMDELGVTADAGTSKIEQLESRRARPAAESQVSELGDPEPEVETKPPAPRAQFRVRIKQSQGPRSRTVSVEADSEDDARHQALHAAGAGWIVLGAERVAAD
ncbi:MAG: PilZ domain-containing protein [Deltaproteobacteria bacterium]|jgi:hypothetical protein|nr:PilZ domain-containing protein [Deltaproteobacteria bacterium]